MIIEMELCQMMSSNLIITSITGSNVSQIITSGTYSLSFNFSDFS